MDVEQNTHIGMGDEELDDEDEDKLILDEDRLILDESLEHKLLKSPNGTEKWNTDFYTSERKTEDSYSENSKEVDDSNVNKTAEANDCQLDVERNNEKNVTDNELKDNESKLLEGILLSSEERPETSIDNNNTEVIKADVTQEKENEYSGVVTSSASPLLAELIESDSKDSQPETESKTTWSTNLASMVSNVSGEIVDEKRKLEISDKVETLLGKRKLIDSKGYSSKRPRMLAQKIPISPQKENIHPYDRSQRKTRVFVIEDTDTEDVYVTNGNNMVSAKTGRLLNPLPGSRKPEPPLREPGEIINSSKAAAPTAKVPQQEDFSWVAKVRDLYKKLKLPSDISAELNQYWKNLDKLDENIARREVDLLELKGQKKWLVTMLARTLESYPIPGQNMHQKLQPVASGKTLPKEQKISVTKERVQNAQNAVNYTQRFYQNSPVRNVRGKGNVSSNLQPTSSRVYQGPTSKRTRMDNSVEISHWPAKPVATKSSTSGRNESSIGPPPAHVKSDEKVTTTSRLQPPPPAHRGDHTMYNRQVRDMWAHSLNEYWTKYFQAYHFDQGAMRKQMSPSQWSAFGLSAPEPKRASPYVADVGKLERPGHRNSPGKQTVKNLSFRDNEKLDQKLDKAAPPVTLGGPGDRPYYHITPEIPPTAKTGIPFTPTVDSKTVPCTVCKAPSIHVCSGCANKWYCSEKCQVNV